MHTKRTLGEKTFNIANYIILSLACVICLYPLWHVLMASVSDPVQIYGNRGFLIKPLGRISFKGYKLVMDNPNIISGFLNSFFYVGVGTGLSMVLTIMGAYVLSRKGVYWNKLFTRLIIFTMYFQGGLIPFYLMVVALGLKDNRMAIILPTAVNTFNLIVMRTAFAGVSPSMWESAKIDGAHEWKIIWHIMVPLAQATIAVVTLYYAVWRWNEWFNPSIFLESKNKYPLQLLLREILLKNEGSTSMINAGTIGQSQTESYRLLIRYCTIVIATIPILVVYPFLQKYFMAGVMIGSVKE